MSGCRVAWHMPLGGSGNRVYLTKAHLGSYKSLPCICDFVVLIPGFKTNSIESILYHFRLYKFVLLQCKQSDALCAGWSIGPLL
jgi:hypothetical protein